MPEKKKHAKRDRGEGSVYETTRITKRKDGTTVETTVYRGYVTLGIVDGKQQRKYISARTKAGANVKIRDLLNRRDDKTLTHTASPTLERWIGHYLTDLAPHKQTRGKKGRGKKGLARSSIAAYKGLARNHIVPRIGNIRLEALQVEHLESVYQAMALGGYSTSYIGCVHALLSGALDIAWRRGRIPRNIALLAILPSGTPRAEMREVLVEEMRAVLEQASKRRMPARWVIRMAYGLRQAECLGLLWDDVDFEHGILHIRQQLLRDRAEHGCGPSTGTVKSGIRPYHGCGKSTGKTTVGVRGETIRPAHLWPCGQRVSRNCPQAVMRGGTKDVQVHPCGKAQAAQCPQAIGGGVHLERLKSTSSEAPLPMPKAIADLLRARKIEQAKERLQEGPHWVGWEQNGKLVDLVFDSPTGRPIGQYGDWSEWQELVAEAGVDPIHPHAARHWTATMLVALGVHPRVAMEMLRHSTFGTTMDLYAKAPSPELAAAAAALSEALLGNRAADG